MATTQVTIHHTFFEVGGTRVRFGIAWPDVSFLMTDWARKPQWVDLEGPNLTETQTFGFGPYRVTYTLFFDDGDDFRTMEALQLQTGTLSLVHEGHSVPVVVGEPKFFGAADRTYDHLLNVTLLSLTSNGVASDGSREAVAVFSRPSS
jgi:hypothetical protein